MKTFAQLDGPPTAGVPRIVINVINARDADAPDRFGPDYVEVVGAIAIGYIYLNRVFTPPPPVEPALEDMKSAAFSTIFSMHVSAVEQVYRNNSVQCERIAAVLRAIAAEATQATTATTAQVSMIDAEAVIRGITRGDVLIEGMADYTTIHTSLGAIIGHTIMARARIDAAVDATQVRQVLNDYGQQLRDVFVP